MSTEITAPKPRFTGRFSPRRLVRFRDYGFVLVFIALFVFLSLSTDSFFRTRNFLNILDQSAPAGIIACAITICIIAGIFDLSTGSIFGVAGGVPFEGAPQGGTTLVIRLLILPGLMLGAGQ